MSRRYIHATALTIEDKGVLIRGPARAGKSTLALDLLERAKHLAPRLVGDDRIMVERVDDRILMRGHPLIAGKIEKRGATPLESLILDVPFAALARLHLIVDLSDQDEEPVLGQSAFCGLALPCASLPRGSDRARHVLEYLHQARLSSIEGQVALTLTESY